MAIVSVTEYTTTLAGSSATVDVTVSSYTASRTVLKWSIRHGNENPSDSLAVGEKLNATTIRFTRNVAAVGLALETKLYLVVHDADTTVGDYTFGAGTTGTVTLSPTVTTAQTYLVSNGQANSGGAFGNDDNVSLAITNSSTVTWTANATNAARVNRFQAVDQIGCSVQYVQTAVTNTTSVSSGAFSAVTMNRTWLESAGLNTAAALTVAQIHAVSLNSTTTLLYESYTVNATAQNSKVFVVSEGAEFTVSRGTFSMAIATATANPTPTFNAGFAWPNVIGTTIFQGLQPANSATDGFHHGSVTADLGASGTLTLTRSTTTVASKGSWEVISWAAVSNPIAGTSAGVATTSGIIRARLRAAGVAAGAATATAIARSRQRAPEQFGSASRGVRPARPRLRARSLIQPAVAFLRSREPQRGQLLSQGWSGRACSRPGCPLVLPRQVAQRERDSV
jgi:hypothetical protein